MLLIVEKDIRCGICHTIHRYAKANNKYMKNAIISSYLEYLHENNLYGWGMSQKLSVNGFEQAKELSEFNENFIKNYDENSNKGYGLEVHLEYQKNLFNLYKELRFLPEKYKIENVKRLFVTYKTKRAIFNQ